MASKLLLFVSIYLLYLTTSAVCNGDLEAGEVYGTQLIHNGTYEKYGRELKKRSKEIEVKAPKNQRIQAIIVKDWMGDGQSRIKRGGVGNKAVKLKLKSPKGRGLKFSVAIYAY